MLIEAKDLQQTVEAVQEVPAQKRRIIVYTGVHPNEGTTELVRPFERVWENYDALVVAQPSELTPHGIWESQRAKYDSRPHPLDPSVIIDETAIEEAFAQGDPTIFLRFHGTPGKTDNDLEILPTMDADQCLSPQLFKTLDQHFPSVEYLGYPPNRICLEYLYRAKKPLPTPNTFINEAIRNQRVYYQNPHGVPVIYSPEDTKWWQKGNLKPDYIVQPKPTQTDIAAFMTTYSQALTGLIAHIRSSIS